MDDADDLLDGLARPHRPGTADGRFAETVTAAARAARGVAAAVLADPRHLDGAAADIDPESLRDSFARDVFEQARTVYEAGGRKGVPLDRLAVRVTGTGRWGQLAAVARDLADLYQSGGAGTDCEYYLRAVRVTGRQLDLYTAAQTVIRDVMDLDSDETDPADMEAVAQQALARVDPPTVGGMASITDVVYRSLDKISDRHRTDRPKPLLTGWTALDGILTGFEPGEHIVVGARPAVGKSAFGMCVATFTAGNLIPTLFVSLEMSDTQLGERVAYGETGAHGGRLRSGKGTADDLYRVGQAAQRVDGWPLHILDRRGMSVPRIYAAAKRLQRRSGLKLLLIDYLQLIRGTNPKAARWEQVGQVSRDLKVMAGDLGIPVISLAQLNRECENRPDGKPRMSDLREAGDLEQDADTIILLSRVSGQTDQQDTIRVCVQVAKQRNGPTGECDLMYVRPQVRFDNLPVFGMGDHTHAGRGPGEAG